MTRRRDDGVGAALLAILDHAPHGDVLARAEGVGLAQLGRDFERHAGGIRGDRVDRGHAQRMKAQMHLKYSKGSRQVRQRCKALHGVEPNSLMQSVSVEWQRGQATGRFMRRTSRSEAVECSGGTMP